MKLLMPLYLTALSNLVASQCNPLTALQLPRILVLTDLSNEPDDQESLVRLLVHSDLYNVTGLIAQSSYWLNDTTHPDHIQEVVGNYSVVYENLQAHTDGAFASPNHLNSVIFSGPSSYGLVALNESLSDGAKHIISVVDSSDEPLSIQA